MLQGVAPQHEITPDEDTRLECQNIGPECSSIGLCTNCNQNCESNITIRLLDDQKVCHAVLR